VIATAVARHIRTGKVIFLRQAGLDRIPDPITRIEVARYLNCKPWELSEVSPFWIDWGLIALDIHNNLSTPTKKE
jgi:hypothetical protein